MRGQRRRRSGLLAAAVVLAMAACGGADTGEQEPVDTDAEAPATQPSEPAAQAPAANVELPEGVTQEDVAAGQQIFNTQICFTCHGVNGAGTPLAPVLADATWLNTDGSLDGIMEIVRNGVPTPVEHPAAMPPMGGIQLSDEQIRQVSAYVYTLSHGS